MSTPKYTNSLINETSPYLLQHAHNPVNWKAWNKESLALAKKEHKLILISIGYSSCHWCHVMEHESFEDVEVAEIMNKYFINIKVDREERPDVDQVYMSAVQLMTGSGGWPLNCIALPDGRPIWGGTYLPKQNWINVLDQLHKLYIEKPEVVTEYAEKLHEGINQSELISFNQNKDDFKHSNLTDAINEWKKYMDFELGGKNRAPKFPLPNNYQFLLRYAIQSNDTQLLNYVNTSLTKMAYGGIYDHIAGGFSRYSVDKKWHIPHFEKMLYDNGQLVSLYAEAYQATKNELYKNVVYETLNFVENELMNKNGAFYSSLDADSLNPDNILKEGAFYVWKKDELIEILKDDFNLFQQYFNINDYGYWENNHYVLIRTVNSIDFATEHNITPEKLELKLTKWKQLLNNYRNQRPKPRLDDKSLTSWNALMLKGYIDAYKVFNEPHFLKIALKNAAFISTIQLQENGNLYHSYKNGKSSISGFLEDYATVINAFISLYEITLDEKWLGTAKQLTDFTFDHFFDTEKSMFYFTSNKNKELITRKMEIEDNVIPASNSIMANNLFKLSHYYENEYYLKISKQMLQNVIPFTKEYGSGYSNWLQLLCNFIGEFYEIAVLGENSLQQITEINKTYIPNKLIAGSIQKSTMPLLEARFIPNQTLVYVCKNGACLLPEKNVQKALSQIDINF